jgi:phosphatidylinositol alpha-1,6-mannosyltransferase
MSRVLYLSPGVFDKGGVSRYARHQVRALRELLGDREIEVLSLLPPDEHAFEEPFAVAFSSFGTSLRGKALFAIAAVLAAASRPEIVWIGHIGLAALGHGIARGVGARSVLNVYRDELTIGFSQVRAAALRRVDRVVSDCHITRADIVARGLRPDVGMTVHWDCVDLARFTLEASSDRAAVLARYGVPPAPDRITVLTLGRMCAGTKYKGYERLLEAMARIPADIPLRLVLAGDGVRRAELEALAHARGLDGRAFFTGRVHESDLTAVYRACDAFALVTDTYEGLPLATIEAAAMGKPVLVGNHDGSREAAEDGITGFVVDPFDGGAIAERLVRLARDSDLRDRLGAAARARIEREHSFERFRARTSELLRDLRVLA